MAHFQHTDMIVVSADTDNEQIQTILLVSPVLLLIIRTVTQATKRVLIHLNLNYWVD